MTPKCSGVWGSNVGFGANFSGNLANLIAVFSDFAQKKVPQKFFNTQLGGSVDMWVTACSFLAAATSPSFGPPSSRSLSLAQHICT